MKYYISQINRTVELNDELVKQHAELDVLHEAPFVIAVITEYGHEPDKEEISDEELSKFCNQVLASEIQALRDLPAVAEFATRNYLIFVVASDTIITKKGVNTFILELGE